MLSLRRRAFLFAAVVAALAARGPLAAAAEHPSLVNGIKQVEEGDFESAIPVLDAAIKDLSKSPGRSKELARAYLYLAIACLQLSREADARAKFIEAIGQDSELTLSTREFPPKIVHFFEEARKNAGVGGGTAVTAPAQAAAPSSRFDQFLEAVKGGDLARVRTLLQQEPGLVRQGDGDFKATGLHWAAAGDQQAMVGLLVAEGADPSLRNRDGETPLQVARRARSTGVMHVLRSLEGDGIFEACRNGDLERVRSVVKRKPALATAHDSEYGATPLHWAAQAGHTEVVSFLLSAGANRTALNGAGETALDVAERSRQPEVAVLLQNR